MISSSDASSLPPPRGLDDVDRVVAVGGRADGERLGDGLRLRHGADEIGPGLERGGDGLQPVACAPWMVKGCSSMRPTLIASWYDLAILVSSEPLAIGTTVWRGSRQPSCSAISKPMRLGALGVVGPQIHVHEAPAVFARDLGTEAVDLVVRAVDADDLRAVDEAVEHLALLEIGGDEHVAFQARAGGMGGDAVGEIAGGSAGDDLEAELLRPRERDGNDAILEGERGIIEGVVLDVKFLHAERLGQPVGFDQRGESGVEADGGVAVDGEQFPVAPHAVRARFDQLARDGVLDEIVVVVGLERTEVELANVDGLLGVLASAFAALEIAEKFFAHSFHRLSRIVLAR